MDFVLCRCDIYKSLLSPNCACVLHVSSFEYLNEKAVFISCGSGACGWGVKLERNWLSCLSGIRYQRQLQQACVVGGGYFVRAPPPSAPCPIVKTLGLNYNREVPSLNLSETTFGNAHNHFHTQSCKLLKSALLPVFHLFQLLSYHVWIDWAEGGSPGKRFCPRGTTRRYYKDFRKEVFVAVVTFAPGWYLPYTMGSVRGFAGVEKCFWKGRTDTRSVFE